MNDTGGKLIIISGPSGAGKSTVVTRLLEQCPHPLKLSVSATTRAPREGEQDGVAYHFLTHQEFQRRRERGEFLESKEVFQRGDWYGTLREEVRSGFDQGMSVILEIDVEGAVAVLEQVPDAVTIFIHPGSLDELERRLRRRGTETDDSIRRRLEVAQHEMTYLPHYRYEVINSSVDTAVQEICDIIQHCGDEPRC